MNHEVSFEGNFRQSPPLRVNHTFYGFMAEYGDGVITYGSSLEMFREFVRQLNPSSDYVLYPGCGVDISPSQVFSGKVVYIDSNQEVVTTLKRVGLEAYCQSAGQFLPENPIDILIFRRFDAYGVEKNLLPEILLGGFVLADGTYDNIRELLKNPTFSPQGVLSFDSNENKAVFDNTDLQDYFEEVETDEELKEVSAKYSLQEHFATYNSAAAVVKEETGKDENIVSEYRKIVSQAIEETMLSFRGRKLSFKDLNEMMNSSARPRIKHAELINVYLPYKKPLTVEHFFIFQRTNQ